jgi:hypothetical protein
MVETGVSVYEWKVSYTSTLATLSTHTQCHHQNIAQENKTSRSTLLTTLVQVDTMEKFTISVIVSFIHLHKRNKLIKPTFFFLRAQSPPRLSNLWFQTYSSISFELAGTYG